jgi:hypothetical protein
MFHFGGRKVKQITVRGIPPDIEKRIRKEAQQKKVSINKALLSILHKSAGRPQTDKKILFHDLDHLSGVWKKEEAEAFAKALAYQRTVDEDLWKRKES